MEERNNVTKTYTDPETGKFAEGNPGRPKGSFSLKTKVIKFLEENPESLSEVVQSLAKDEDYRALLWQMIDGRPQQDVTSGGEKMPQPIYVLRDNSTQEDKPTQQAD